MKRMPKFTSRMFKPKMKRFGGAAPKMPRMPRIKKFQSGGDVENEVIISPEEGRKEYAKEYADRERKLKQREEESKNLVKRYLSERKKADAAEAAKKAEKDDLKKKFDEYMEDRKRQEAEADWNFMQQRKQGVRTAKSGGVMKSSCCRGDGIAKKGKTRGRYV